MSLSNFNPDAMQAVLKAGWHPGRAVDIESWREQLSQAGFSEIPLAMDILKSFGGLKIKPAEREHRAFDPEETLFNPAVGFASVYDRIQEWSRDLLLTLYPLASIYNDMGALVLGSDGRFYAITDGGISFLGSTLGEVFNILILAQLQPEPIITTAELFDCDPESESRFIRMKWRNYFRSDPHDY